MDLKALLSDAWGLRPTKILPIDQGLINQTWLVHTSTADYILQQINIHVFKDPQQLQQQLVVLSNELEASFLVPLRYLPSSSGLTCISLDHQFYRLLAAITPSRTLTRVTVEHSILAAQALKVFHGSLSKIDIQNWKEPIENFLNVGIRIQQFIQAKEMAFLHRMQSANTAVHLLESNWIYLLDWQQFLEREPKVLIHADPKLSNFLFHPNGRQVRALIDWDTIQLGSPYYDYADMIRSYCSFGEEVSEGDALFRADIFEALVETFKVDETKIFTAACGVILVQALRFLTDYLQNDSYYKVNDEGHNLRRAENQLCLAEQLKEYWFTTRKRGR
jgi:thiamine kinase-like enzyme